MKFAKLDKDKLTLCPKTGHAGGAYHLNLPCYYKHNQDKAANDGWMELVETPRPDGHCYAAYSILNGKVVQEWRESPAQEPAVDPIEKLRADVDYIAMMTDVELED